MLNSTSKASTNGAGHLLPQSIAGKVLAGGRAFVANMKAVVNDKGNTHYEWVEFIEVASEAEGKKLCESFKAKYDGELLIAGKVHKSDIKQKVGKGGTAYTTGGNTCVTHNLAEPIKLGDREYRVTAGVTIKERSRNKVPYLCADVSMAAILVSSGGNGPKAVGETVEIAPEDF